MSQKKDKRRVVDMGSSPSLPKPKSHIVNGRRKQAGKRRRWVKP